MPRLLPVLVAALALTVPASALASSLPRAHPVDLSGVTAPDRLPDLGAHPRVPGYLKLGGNLHGAAADIREEQFQDQHGHVLSFATDNPSVDLTPFANLLASTYHHDEIELVRVFVTNRVNLERICGSDAVACYAPDNPGKTRTGLMIISYEDSDIEHAVIHEYGHHVDNNTYNLGGLNGCGVDGDGSRRWFFAREMGERILENLTCDPQGDWGHLLPEVYAEDYAQMVGIPRAEYHPAISVRPPTAGEKRALKTDLDIPFEPIAKTVKGRASRKGTATFSLSTSLPVFVAARRAKGVRSVQLRGCNLPGFSDVFRGKCKVVVRSKKPRGRFSFRLVVY